MIKSATAMLLERTFKETWKRGEKYADGGRVKINLLDDNRIEATVIGSNNYQTALQFRSGGISRRCSCPVGDFCKHMVAVAIIWDEKRGMNRPVKQEIEEFTIPPSLVTASDISNMYKAPLKANLDLMRMAASEYGSWSRPHSRLPQMPKFNTAVKKPLEPQEVQEAFTQIKRWSTKSSYDPYFCAGEMVAAFCEVMRIIEKRMSFTSPVIVSEILRESQRFHYLLIMQLIDDSEGLHIFTEAHLNNIYDNLKKMKLSPKDQTAVYKKLDEFDRHRDDY